MIVMLNILKKQFIDLFNLKLFLNSGLILLAITVASLDHAYSKGGCEAATAKQSQDKFDPISWFKDNASESALKINDLFTADIDVMSSAGFEGVAIGYRRLRVALNVLKSKKVLFKSVDEFVKLGFSGAPAHAEFAEKFTVSTISITANDRQGTPHDIRLYLIAQEDHSELTQLFEEQIDRINLPPDIYRTSMRGIGVRKVSDVDVIEYTDWLDEEGLRNRRVRDDEYEFSISY